MPVLECETFGFNQFARLTRAGNFMWCSSNSKSATVRLNHAALSLLK